MTVTKRFPPVLSGIVGILSIVGTLVVGSSFAVAESSQSSFNSTQADAIEQIMREYLLENPEFMLEVFAKLDEKRAEEERLNAEGAISANSDELFNDGYSYVYGNPDGDVTVVEFFDYKCPYCKRSVEDVIAATDEDGNIRLVLKDFPILSDESTMAARAALAAISQNKYMELHIALMATQGSLDEARIMRIAEEAGLDVERLRRDMTDPGIDAAIDRTHELARRVGVDGTPAFIIGSQLVPGAISKERLLEIVEEARTAS